MIVNSRDPTLLFCTFCITVHIIHDTKLLVIQLFVLSTIQFFFWFTHIYDELYLQSDPFSICMCYPASIDLQSMILHGTVAFSSLNKHTTVKMYSLGTRVFCLINVNYLNHILHVFCAMFILKKWWITTNTWTNMESS